MPLGLVGIKQGMSQIFNENGLSIPVTLISISSHYVTQIKTLDKDKYSALQIATGKVKVKNVTKPYAGHFSKANVPISKKIVEFSILSDSEHYKVGDEIPISIFSEGQSVDVTGISKGSGFTGVIKRWNFASQKASHGNSLSHNRPGSIGQNQSPGKVFKGKKMAGHAGNEQVTIQNLEIMKVDVENSLIVVKGAIPGPSGKYVKILPTIKNRNAESKGSV